MEEIFANGESTLFLLIKIGIILFLLVYLVFAAVIVKQVKMMTETLVVGLEPQIKFMVFLHFIVSLAALIFAVATL